VQDKSITLKPGDEIKVQKSPRNLAPLQIRVLAANGLVLGELPARRKSSPADKLPAAT